MSKHLKISNFNCFSIFKKCFLGHPKKSVLNHYRRMIEAAFSMKTMDELGKIPIITQDVARIIIGTNMVIGTSFELAISGDGSLNITR